MGIAGYALLGTLGLAMLSRKWSLAPIVSVKLIVGSTLFSLVAFIVMDLEPASVYSGLIFIASQGFFYTVIILWSFYRDPERNPPDDPSGVLSPADGKVVYIRRLDREHLPTSEKSKRKFVLGELQGSSLANRELWQIGISMVFTDVHVNRSPISGTIKLLHRQPGQFLSLRDEHAFGLNERQTMVIENEHMQVGVVQIASRLVRRIEAFGREGDSFAAGQRIGIIKFGSQVDLIIPVDLVQDVTVRLGQALVAGETVICRIVPQPKVLKAASAAAPMHTDQAPRKMSRVIEATERKWHCEP